MERILGIPSSMALEECKYLEVSKSVPAQIHIQNFSTRISYEGMERKCFSCGNVDHVKQDCPKRASVNDRLNSARSFAGVLSGVVDGNQVQLPAQPSGKVAQALEFPPLELRQMFTKRTGKSPVTQPQPQPSSSGSDDQVSSGVVSLVKQQQSSSSGLSPHEQVSSGEVNVDEEAMEVIDEQEAARKRGHEEGDSDATSEASGSVEKPQLIQQTTELTPFKVPSVNKLLESQVIAAKLRARTKKSKK